MLNHRSGLNRFALAPAFLAAMLVLAPAAKAKVRVGFGVNITLPPHVNVGIGNYDPYYVGRVFYQPLGVWRPVYSFPVETPYGVEYAPYVYDGPRVVCHDYIPGYEAGYGRFVIEGRGHYDSSWHRGHREYRAYNRHSARHDRGWHGHTNRTDHGRRNGPGDDDRSGHTARRRGNERRHR